MTEQRRYAVEISNDALHALERLPKKAVTQIIKKIEALATEPRPRGCEKLDGNNFRVRSGTYRILYSVEDDRLLITVIDVGPRKDIYRRYNRHRR